MFEKRKDLEQRTFRCFLFQKNYVVSKDNEKTRVTLCDRKLLYIIARKAEDVKGFFVRVPLTNNPS